MSNVGSSGVGAAGYSSNMTKNEKNKNKNWVISPFTVPTLHRGRGLRIIGVNDRPTRILHEFRQSLLEFLSFSK